MRFFLIPNLFPPSFLQTHFCLMLVGMLNESAFSLTRHFNFLHFFKHNLTINIYTVFFFTFKQYFPFSCPSIQTNKALLTWHSHFLLIVLMSVKGFFDNKMLLYVLCIQDQKFKKILRAPKRSIGIKYLSMHISFLMIEFLAKMSGFSIVLLVSK